MRGVGLDPPVLELGGQSVRRDAAESRERILAAARRLFGERGVGGVSMHEIGRVAGVGQGTLYRRFSGKGTLCSVLLAGEMEGLHREVRERLRGDGGGLRGLSWLIGRLAEFNEKNAPLLHAIRSDSGRRGVELYRNPFYGWLRETVVWLVRRAEESGDVAEGSDAEVTADVVLAALNIDLYLFQREELEMDAARIVAGVRRTVLEGLKVRPG